MKHKTKNKINLMNVVPIRDDLVETSYNEAGLVILSYPRFRNQWVQKYFVPKKMNSHFSVELEEYGSVLWDLIDGSNTVSDIVQCIQSKFKDEPQMEDRVLLYIRQLHKDKFIKYFIPR